MIFGVICTILKAYWFANKLIFKINTFGGRVDAATGINDATGFSIGTAVAGNNVTFKALEINGSDTNKVIINRPLAGGTFELTFVDPAAGNSSTDLELKVAF